MGSQRQLNALLFELQTAQSPIAQAKILARAWRTVRELSPTDRKLLARHVGFDGAEDILEGLAKKSGGVAPAMLLQMLSNARGTDGSALRNIMTAFRDPSRRDDALSKSLDLAADLMKDQAPAEDVEDDMYELRADEPVVEETPDEASEVPSAVDEEGQMAPAETDEPTGDETGVPAESVPDEQSEPPPAPPAPDVDREPESTPKRPTRPPHTAIDWSRWDSTDVVQRPAPAPRRDVRPTVSKPGGRRIGEAAATIVGGESSILRRLRGLHRAVPDLAGSSVSTLGELIEDFPDGWARRRALSALIEAGIPQSPDEAITLVESYLDRELDRRWCLGVLARRGDLSGASLERAGELLSSPSARRRLSRLGYSAAE